MPKHWRFRKQARYSEDEIVEKERMVAAKYGDLIRSIIRKQEGEDNKK